MASHPDKTAARAAVRARRNARNAHEQEHLGRQLAETVLTMMPSHPAVVSAYRSLPGEPDTAPLLDALLAAGHRVLLPRIVGRDLEWVEVDDRTTYARGPLGISEPTGPALPALPAPLLAARVLVLPGLSADRSGWRLGQGGGYYDRTLASLPRYRDGGPLRVVLLYDDDVVEHVPHEEHDCPVDAIATASGVIRVEG